MVQLITGCPEILVDFTAGREHGRRNRPAMSRAEARGIDKHGGGWHQRRRGHRRRTPMAKRGSGGSRQPELFPRSKTTRPIPIEENHRLVQLADRLDWTELEMRAEAIRASKLKNGAGRPPHLRA